MSEINQQEEYDVIIAGGGLAGFTAAILLSRKEKKVLLIEKYSYPFHKVCGEYVSNEVLGLLKSFGFDPFSFGASQITRLRISTPSGKNISSKLDLGGFGLSRFKMDEAFYHLALTNNVTVLTDTKVTDISFHENIFNVETNSGVNYTSKLAIGCYGKRDSLDKKLNRDFIKSHTGYMAVKYHVKTDYPIDEVGLDNFEGGYCGIVKIEEDKFNICYLYKRNNRYNFTSIRELEENILFRNPVIKNIFSNAEFIFRQPEAINEISFAGKKPIEDHIFMCGDAAGLITPLCGNGMSMAIHSAKLLCELILNLKILDNSQISNQDRMNLEESYQKIWRKYFSRRLATGRAIQNLFGNKLTTEAGIRLIHAIPKLERWIISGTHGKPISVI